jgi:hypothetical protein
LRKLKNPAYQREDEEPATMPQRVVFSFNESGLDSLKQVEARGDFPSMGAAVRESIQISEILQNQAAEGYTEVVLRNPKTNQEKIIMIPSLQKIGKLKRA